MPIISISADEKVLEEVDDAIERGYFSNRSDLFRKGAKSAVSEVKRIKLPEKADAILIVMHEERHENEVTALKHSFDSIITMQTHSKVDENNCLEIFVLKGDGKKISDFVKEIYSNKHMKYSKLVTP